MKDELWRQIMKRFVGLQPKTYSYIKDNDNECKKTKGTKGCVIKWDLKFQDCKMFKFKSNYKYS